MSRSGKAGRTPRALRPLAGVTALAIAGVGFIAAPSVAVIPPDETTIDLLSINDFHGRIEADGQSAGGAVLACAVDQFRAENPNTLFVSAGDSIGASTFTSFIQDDQPTLDVLNEIGLDVSAFGNHEFDQGQDDVNNRVIPNSNFPYVAANILDAAGDPVYDPYVVLDVDGVSVGFIGAITEEMPALVSPDGITGLTFSDMGVAVNAYAAQLSDGDGANGEADIVVVLVHDGASTSDLASADGTPYGDLVANANPNIDAIISGHTHQAYLHDVDGMWVTQTGQYGENLGHLSLTFDRASGEVTAATAANVDLVTVPGDPRATPPIPRVAFCPGDPAVQAIVDDAVAVAAVEGAVPLGEITADLNRAVHQTINQGTGLPELTENRGGESTLGNAVADVQLWAAQRTNPAAQIAFMNPGGLRQNLTYASSAEGEGDGVVTFREAAIVQPFANTLVTTQLTGAQIVQVLEEQWQPAGASRPFLKLGVSEGFAYTYDPDAPAGQHVLSVTLDGVELSPTTLYTVVANSFLAAGGDSFFTLNQGVNKADTGQSDLVAMVDYLAAFGSLSPDYVQRAVGVNWVSSPAGGFPVGSEIAIDLSSLSFSTSEPRPTSVDVTLGGVAVGTFPVDTAYVVTTDEIGRAQVRVTVPEGLPFGVVDLVATDPTTGTSVTVGVNLGFSDVPLGLQFYDEIMWLANEGISTGWPDGTFRPVTPIARDAMAAFMYRLAQEPAFTPPTSSPFSDVALDNMYFDEIAWLWATEVSTGWPDGTYRPLSPVNRDAMAAFMYRLAGSPAVTLPAASPFSDIGPGDQFYTEIVWLAQTGISTGWPDGTFRPVTPINRDAMAAFMFRYSEAFGQPQLAITNS